MNKIIIAITGASGAIYAKCLMDALVPLNDQYESVGIVMSDNAKMVWETELDNKDYTKYPFTFYQKMISMPLLHQDQRNTISCLWSLVVWVH